MITSVKGMRDLLPPETRVWNRLEETTRAVFSLYGYDEIRTPVLEPTELFVRSVGEASDIVHKEMYSFTDRGGREVSLRPENTASVARAYVEHGMPQAGGAKKLYYVGPQYRYERPQKGRYREFRQIGAEVLGAADPATDAELLVMLFDLLGRLGFTGLSVSLNSVGSEESRPAYVEALRAYLLDHEEKMGEDDRRRLRDNPLRVLDTKDRSLAEVLAGAPLVLDHLDPASRTHHEELLSLLDAERIPYRVEPRLVRGLDYYTRTVFEVTAQGLGAQNALLGGGRYDRLVSDLGGPKTPGIGFAIGEDRLVDVLPEAFRRAAIAGFAPVALVAIDPTDRAAALAIAGALRRAGVAVDLDPAGKGPGAGLKAASSKGCRTAVLVGGRERESGVAVVKNLVERSQTEVPLADLPRVLKGETP
ncbi:MAG: histidine--tRNA ligase [Holophagales bacterium]|nr:histidine--tRNA ligase [Holophagales bacterium]